MRIVILLAFVSFGIFGLSASVELAQASNNFSYDAPCHLQWLVVEEGGATYVYPRCIGDCVVGSPYCVLHLEVPQQGPRVYSCACAETEDGSNPWITGNFICDAYFSIDIHNQLKDAWCKNIGCFPVPGCIAGTPSYSNFSDVCTCL